MDWNNIVRLVETTVTGAGLYPYFVGNNKLFSDDIQNFSANPYRLVELSAQISGAADPKQVIAALKQRIGKYPT
jgi:small conductance mechanosensitive channel